MSRSTQWRRNPGESSNATAVQWPTTSPLLVVDLEATCWENRPPPHGQAHEIIEIGWALLDVDASPPNITRTGTFLVKPVRSTVSAFCTKLTTITPELLEAEGITLEEAFQKLVKEVHSPDYAWCSWGDYDRNMIERQCKAFGLDSPFASSHFNVKSVFKSVYPSLSGGYGMNTAFKALMKKPIEGTHHRGGDDARNIADILGRLMADKRASETREDSTVQ